jgi:outer membrane cobalamin receptor
MRNFSRLFLRLLPAAFLLLASFVFAPPASAQSAATLEVTVFDSGEAAVADATAVLQGLSSPGEERQGVPSGEGRYRFDVPPGRYRLVITHTFLRRLERELALGAGERRELRVTLQLEPLSQSVLVSAEALAITTAAASEPATIITREEIDRRGAIHIGPLLSTLPGIGVVQADSAGGTASLFLDGGNSNFTKVLVDGVPLNQPGGAIDFSNFTLDNIEKIEIVRGAQSALSGSDAMTGVIEVLTHRGSTRVPLLRLEGDGGTFSTGRGMARLSGLAGALDYSAAAAYFSTKGRGPNNRFINRTLSGNFGVRPGEGHSLRLTLRNNTSDAGAPGQTAFTPPNLDQHNALQHFTAGLVWDGSTGVHWQHRVEAGETYIRQVFDNPASDFFTDPDPFGGCAFASPRSANAVASPYCDFPYHAPNQFNRAGFQAQTSYVAGRGSVTAGYVYEVENGFLNALSGGHARRNNQAGFLAGRWQLLPRVVVNAGFRVEDNDSFGTDVVPRAGIAFTPRTGGEILGATRLRFTYGEGIKEPRLDQSFGTDICNPGNPGLLPEQSRTIYTGVEQRLARDRVRFSADYYESRFRDIVSFTFCSPGGPCPVAPPGNCPFGFGTFFNTDLARARGATVSAEARVNRRLLISGNYTYDDTRVLESPNAFDPAQSPGNRLIRRPVHSGNLVVGTDWGRFGGTLTGRFAGRRTDSDFLFPPLGLSSNPGYAVFDLAGSFRFNAQATAIARIDNLFDKEYQGILGYPALGRGAYIGMRFTFGGE